MIAPGVLRRECRRNQEEAIIALLAAVKNLSLDEAMDIFYHSRLSEQIADGVFGIDNLSPAYLVEDLIENEPDLFHRS